MSQKNIFDKVGILAHGNFNSDIVYKTRLPNGITVLRVITLFSEDSRQLFTRLKKIMDVNISATTPIVYYPKTIQQLYFFYKLFQHENLVSHVEDTKKRIKKALNTLQVAYFKLIHVFPEDVL